MASESLKLFWDDLQELRKSIDDFSKREFLLHRSKCRCLLESYALLPKLEFYSTLVERAKSRCPVEAVQIRSLMCTIKEGMRFLENCTFQPGFRDWMLSASRSLNEEWAISKAFPIALSTEILDVHLHDFEVCIFALLGFWRPVPYPKDSSAPNLWPSVKEKLKEIWASVDDEGDIRKMQDLFMTNLKSKKLQSICKSICERLSESITKAQPNLNAADAIVPPYLWMDPPGFGSEMKKILSTRLSRQSDVAPISLMGGKFASKYFLGPASKEALTNEAVIQGSLRHGNVMHLLWCTKSSESQCLVMELMDGNLGQVIERRRLARPTFAPFSLLTGIDIMLQIAKGMEYLHDSGIVHRDLKSGNILVKHSQIADNRDQFFSVKVADFGLSKVKQNASLISTKKVGTSIWRAPEVLNTKDDTKYTSKADVYSFAIVCAEILTGLPPDELLPCEGMSKLYEDLMKGQRPRLPSSCPRVIADYIRRCWDGDATRRPTFKEIRRVLCCFKACLLSGQFNWTLASSDFPAHVSWGCEDVVRIEGTLQGSWFHHPVLDLPSELEQLLLARTGHRQRFMRFREEDHIKMGIFEPFRLLLNLMQTHLQIGPLFHDTLHDPIKRETLQPFGSLLGLVEEELESIQGPIKEENLEPYGLLLKLVEEELESDQDPIKRESLEIFGSLLTLMQAHLQIIEGPIKRETVEAVGLFLKLMKAHLGSIQDPMKRKALEPYGFFLKLVQAQPKSIQGPIKEENLEPYGSLLKLVEEELESDQDPIKRETLEIFGSLLTLMQAHLESIQGPIKRETVEAVGLFLKLMKAHLGSIQDPMKRKALEPYEFFLKLVQAQHQSIQG